MNGKLKLYYTSDTHGYLFPVSFTDQRNVDFGLLNCISQYEKDGNTLILDGGDTLQGSPLTRYLVKSGEGPAALAEVFREGGYDGLTLGNHDFNFGSGYMKKYLQALELPCICANVEDREGRIPLEKSRIFVMENGLKAGVTGIVTDYVNVWEQEETLGPLKVTDAFTAAARQLEAMKPMCDITICMYHGGYEGDADHPENWQDSGENIGYKICRKLDFDLLLCAHQHMESPGRSLWGTYTMELCANAMSFALISIEVEEGRKTISSRIIPAGGVHKEQPFKRPEPLMKRVMEWLDVQAGQVERELPGRDKLWEAMHGSPVADFFNMIQLEASGADFSCTGLGNEPIGIPKVVTTRDIVAAYPFANTLLVLEVDKQVIKAALERCAEYFTLENGQVRISDAFLMPKIEHYNYDYFAGLSYCFDISRPVGSRVVEMLVHGRPLEDRTYTLCLNNYRASGTGGYEVYKKCRVVKRMNQEVGELAGEYLKRHKPAAVKKNGGVLVMWGIGSE